MCRFKKNEGRNNFCTSNAVYTVNECNKTNEDDNSSLIYKTGIVNETIINFLIDCGSKVSTLTYRTFSKIKNVDLKPTNIGLKIFTKQVIEVVGCCYLTVELEEVEKLQRFIVVAAGRDALGIEYISWYHKILKKNILLPVCNLNETTESYSVDQLKQKVDELIAKYYSKGLFKGDGKAKILKCQLKMRRTMMVFRHVLDQFRSHTKKKFGKN